MNFYMNGTLKVKNLTKLTCSLDKADNFQKFHLEGTSCGSWSSSWTCPVVSKPVIDRILHWWKKCQAGEMFGFTDTDGDGVAFELDGRYMNYWVNADIKVRHLSKLRLEGKTVHLDGTSTGSHASSRMTTAPTNVTSQELDKVIEMFKKRPNYVVFCIGSAGHGSGTAKDDATKDDLGLLDTKTDIEDCKAYMKERSNFFEFFGSYEVSGRAGSADGCKSELKSFFAYCKERKIPPIVYYTGHGDRDGDWCFPDGGYITFSSVMELNTSGWKPTIWSDCCYSGKWAAAANGKARVIAAAAAAKTAINRVFAKAVFTHSKDHQDRLWSTDIDAVMADFDETSIHYFRGDNGPWPTAP